MSWLSEIENRLKAYGSIEGNLAVLEKERLARVIRELVRYIRVMRSTDDQREIAIAYESICSPDAKELLE